MSLTCFSAVSLWILSHKNCVSELPGSRTLPDVSLPNIFTTEWRGISFNKALHTCRKQPPHILLDVEKYISTFFALGFSLPEHCSFTDKKCFDFFPLQGTLTQWAETYKVLTPTAKNWEKKKKRSPSSSGCEIVKIIYGIWCLGSKQESSYFLNQGCLTYFISGAR